MSAASSIPSPHDKLLFLLCAHNEKTFRHSIENIRSYSKSYHTLKELISHRVFDMDTTDWECILSADSRSILCSWSKSTEIRGKLVERRKEQRLLQPFHHWMCVNSPVKKLSNAHICSGILYGKHSLYQNIIPIFWRNIPYMYYVADIFFLGVAS